MKAKQIYELIAEAYNKSDIEVHRRAKFRSGPFKGYELGDIVDNLPETMQELYIDMYPEGPKGEKFKESLGYVLQDAQSKGKVKNVPGFRDYFPHLWDQLIKYGRNAGYTLKEINRYKPSTELHMATGGQIISNNVGLANSMRAQMGADDFERSEYNDNKEPQVDIKDPTMWAKGKRILTDMTCIIRETRGKLMRTNYEGAELDVELELLGVTTDGYPIALHLLGSHISEDYLMYAENLSRGEYRTIEQEGLAIHMIYVKRAINEGIHKIDGNPYVMLHARRENVKITIPEFDNLGE